MFTSNSERNENENENNNQEEEGGERERSFELPSVFRGLSVLISGKVDNEDDLARYIIA